MKDRILRGHGSGGMPAVIIVLLLISGEAAQSGDRSTPTASSVEVFLSREWLIRPHWVPEGTQAVGAALLNDPDGEVTFIVQQHSARAVWACRLVEPVESSRWSTVEVTVKATNVDTGSNAYAFGLLVPDSGRSRLVPLILHEDLTDAGHERTFRGSLAELCPGGSPVIGFAAQVVSSPYAPAAALMELRALRFLDPVKGMQPASHSPAMITVEVFDCDGSALPGAVVVAGAERLNAATWTETDKGGTAALQVPQTQQSTIMVRVEKDGFASVECEYDTSVQSARRVVLPDIRTVRGRAATVRGTPLAGAAVNIDLPNFAVPGQRWFLRDCCITDSEGRWQLQVPAGNGVCSSALLTGYHAERGYVQTAARLEDLPDTGFQLTFARHASGGRARPLARLADSGNIGVLAALAADRLESDHIRIRAALSLLDALAVRPESEEDILRSLLHSCVMAENGEGLQHEMTRILGACLKRCGRQPAAALSTMRSLLPPSSVLPASAGTCLSSIEAEWRSAFEGLDWMNFGAGELPRGVSLFSDTAGLPSGMLRPELSSARSEGTSSLPAEIRSAFGNVTALPNPVKLHLAAEKPLRARPVKPVSFHSRSDTSGEPRPWAGREPLQTDACRPEKVPRAVTIPAVMSGVAAPVGIGDSGREPPGVRPLCIEELFDDGY